MNRRKILWVVAAVAGSLLVNGCKTAPKSANPRASGTPVRRAATKPADEKVGLQKLASAHAHYAAGVVHELNNETELALEDFQRAAKEDPDNETLILEVSRRLLQYKQPDKALEFLLAATARGNASGEIYARLGSAYARLGRNDEALAANRIAVNKSPRFLTGYQNLFLSLVQAKQGEEALKVLEKAGQLVRVDAEFLIGLTDLYQNYMLQFPTQREAVQAKALEMLVRAETLKPTQPQTRLRLADGLYSLGDSRRAATIYLSLLDQIEDLPLLRENVRAKLADIYLRGDDRKRAREQLEAIVRDDPSNAQAYYFLGNLAYDEKRWANAAELLKKTLLFNPNFEQAYYDLTAAQLAANDAGGALATLDQVRGKFSQTFLTEYLTALAQGRQKNFAEAIKHYTAAEVIAQAGEPKRLTAEFYFEVGIAFERKGDRAEAEKHFERALVLKPEFPEAQNYLGYMWAEQGEKLDRARDLIEKALKAEPKSAAYLDSMGWVLFKLNQPKEALDYLLKAVSLNGEPDATLYDHLGDIYSALHQAEKAHEAWSKSLAVEASELVRKKIDSPKAP
jgi:tetratricopeptide (TPR) repeat protein